MEWSESGSTFQSGKRHTPHKPIGGHTIKDVSPTVFGVDDDKTYKKVQNNGGGALYYQKGRRPDSGTSGQASVTGMSNVVYIQGQRIERKMISCTRKWGDHVTIGFETDGPARLTAVCDLLCDGGQDSKSGQNIIWDGAPAGQYVFYAQATADNSGVTVTLDVHGVVSSLTLPPSSKGDNLIAFEIEATTHKPGGKSDNYALFRHNGSTIKTYGKDHHGDDGSGHAA